MSVPECRRNFHTDLFCGVLQTGQFLGARPDFIPEPICRQLIKLQDQASWSSLPSTTMPPRQILLNSAAFICWKQLVPSMQGQSCARSSGLSDLVAW